MIMIDDENFECITLRVYDVDNDDNDDSDDDSDDNNNFRMLAIDIRFVPRSAIRM